MKKATRRRYSWEYKQAAVAMHREQGYGKTEVARRLGIDRSMVDRWERELYGPKKKGAQEAEGSTASATEDQRDTAPRRRGPGGRGFDGLSDRKPAR